MNQKRYGRQGPLPSPLLGLALMTFALGTFASDITAEAPTAVGVATTSPLGPPPAQPATGQEDTNVLIEGVVTSEDGRPLRGVAVTLRNEATGQTTQVYTGANGRFQFAGLDTGASYSVEAQVLGYAASSRSGVRPAEGGAEALVLELAVQAIALEGMAVSDFRVGETADMSYRSRNTLAGARTRADLMDIPQSINIVNERVIQDFGATEAWDAVRYAAPGLSMRDRRRDDVIMRGFRTRWTFIDGTINRRYYPTPLFNVDRVEVIKGPAALLYGQNSPNGGFLNYVTKVPQVRAARSVRMTGGENNFMRGQLDFTGPLLGDDSPLAYRMIVGWEDSESFRNLDRVEQYFVAPSITHFITPQTSLTLALTFTDDARSIGYTFIDESGRPADLPRNFTLSDRDHQEASTKTDVTATLLHALSPDWSLRLFGQTNRVENNRAQIRARNLVNGGLTIERDFRSQVQDINDFDGAFEMAGRYNLLGVPQALSFGTEVNRISQLNTGDEFTFPTLSLATPQYGLSPVEFIRSRSDYQNTWQHSFFAMNQATLWDERIRAVAGARYIYLDVRGGADKRSAQSSEVSSYLARRLGLVFQPSRELSFYLNNSDTFQPNAGSLGEDQLPLPPSVGEIWEVGARADLFDGRLSGSVALFDIVSTNNRLPDFDNPGQLLLLDQENRGVEFELLGQIGGLQLGGNLYRGNAEEPDGTRVERVSDLTLGAFGRYDVLSGVLRGLYLGAGMNYMGDQAGSGGAAYTLPSYTVSNAFLGYRTGQFTVSLNANNLTDADYIDSAVRYETRVSAPRSFRVSVNFAF